MFKLAVTVTIHPHVIEFETLKFLKSFNSRLNCIVRANSLSHQVRSHLQTELTGVYASSVHHDMDNPLRLPHLNHSRAPKEAAQSWVLGRRAR